jgi:hypothetical protein
MNQTCNSLLPQGLKPAFLAVRSGTAGAMPFPTYLCVYATACSDEFTLVLRIQLAGKNQVHAAMKFPDLHHTLIIAPRERFFAM